LNVDVWVLAFDRTKRGLIDLFFLSALSIGELVLPSTPHFLWVTEFPLFSSNDKDKQFLTRGRRWSSTHHPFTAPMYEDLPAFYAGDYGSVRAQHYDLVLNGVEIGGGSVRIHDPAMQEYVFRDVLQVSTGSKTVPFSFHHLCMPLDPLEMRNLYGFEYRNIFYHTESSGQRASATSGVTPADPFIFSYLSRVLFFLAARFQPNSGLRRSFSFYQLDEPERQSFNHLIHALKCGAPPHGGLALGKQSLSFECTVCGRPPPHLLLLPISLAIILSSQHVAGRAVIHVYARAFGIPTHMLWLFQRSESVALPVAGLTAYPDAPNDLVRAFLLLKILACLLRFPPYRGFRNAFRSSSGWSDECSGRGFGTLRHVD
jgi:hypothetical protein